jgi:hypothetical protein
MLQLIFAKELPQIKLGWVLLLLHGSLALQDQSNRKRSPLPGILSSEYQPRNSIVFSVLLVEVVYRLERDPEGFNPPG